MLAVCSAADSVFSSNTPLHIHTLSLSLFLTHIHSLSEFLCHTLSSVSVVVGNGLNTAPPGGGGGERESPADRQSTMPPSVPIRKDKKDVPVSRHELYSSGSSIHPLSVTTYPLLTLAEGG